MSSIAELWENALDASDDAALAEALSELSAIPGSTETIARAVEKGPRRRSLQTLTRRPATDLALALLPTLVRLVASSHSDVLFVRDVLRTLPREQLARRIGPLVEECLSSGSWETPRRLAEALVELQLRAPLERILVAVSSSDDIDWREVAEDFQNIWNTPRWGALVADWE
jgi:hypothetical protein